MTDTFEPPETDLPEFSDLIELADVDMDQLQGAIKDWKSQSDPEWVNLIEPEIKGVKK